MFDGGSAALTFDVSISLDEDLDVDIKRARTTTRPLRIAGFVDSERKARTPIDLARDDLSWYFNGREAALGLRSAGVFGDEFEGGIDEDLNAEEQILLAVSRERPIRRALGLLTYQFQLVLASLYTERQRLNYPLVSSAFDREVARVVHLTNEAQRLPAPGNAVYEAIERALQEAAKAKKSTLRKDLEDSAKALITEACEKYVEVRATIQGPRSTPANVTQLRGEWFPRHGDDVDEDGVRMVSGSWGRY